MSEQPLIRPNVRQGWEEQFRGMAERGGDWLLDERVPTRWDEEGWGW